MGKEVLVVSLISQQNVMATKGHGSCLKDRNEFVYRIPMKTVHLFSLISKYITYKSIDGEYGNILDTNHSSGICLKM